MEPLYQLPQGYAMRVISVSWVPLIRMRIVGHRDVQQDTASVRPDITALLVRMILSHVLLGLTVIGQV